MHSYAFGREGERALGRGEVRNVGPK